MDAIERIREIVEAHPVVLFMKGTPEFPTCARSAGAAEVLRRAGGQFHAVNVLEDPEIRANLPRYAQWPTFPQLFINGELIGGCDITTELYDKGELTQMMQELAGEAVS